MQCDIWPMNPFYREQIWGGRRLFEQFGKDLPAEVNIGESWEISAYPEMESTVASGPEEGRGLLDMVRVESGRVEYWPHLGRGKFGPGVVMENAPFIESFGELTAARLRFVDLDGSGAASLIYIGKGEVCYWINQGGNRFGPERCLLTLPYIDNLSSAQVLDFLGDGSRCLVWSSPLPAQ